jgi:hypothetical protein
MSTFTTISVDVDYIEQRVNIIKGPSKAEIILRKLSPSTSLNRNDVKLCVQVDDKEYSFRVNMDDMFRALRACSQ